MTWRKSFLLFSLFILWPLIIYAATRTVTATGNWTNTGTWLGGNIPISTDDVIMNSSTGVTIQNTENITVKTLVTGNSNTITIDAGGQLTVDNTGLDALTTNNNTTIVVNGNMTINGNMVDNNSLFFTITGIVIVNGNLIMANNATIDVDGTGTLIINGNFTGNNNTDVNVDGSMEVNGDINVGNNSDLTGTGNLSVTGTCSDGSASFCESSVLPVKLLSFGGKVVINDVVLDWATYEEENFDYFCIERSSNGMDYTCIGEISGTGNGLGIENYRFWDKSPYPGRSYYRLKSIDLNRSFEYSRIIRIDFKGQSPVSVYPNPSDGQFTIRLDMDPVRLYKIQVLDSRGLIVHEDFLPHYQVEYHLPNLLKPGRYLVRISENESRHWTTSMVVR